MRRVKRRDTQTAGQLKDSKKGPAEREEPRNRTARGAQRPWPDMTAGAQADEQASRQASRRADRQAGWQAEHTLV